MFWRTLGRLMIVALASLGAMLISLLVLVTLGAERLTQALAGRELSGDSIGTMLEALIAAMRLVAAASILPALGMIVIGEIARIRSFLYYVIGGGTAMVAIPLIARIGHVDGIMPATIVWQVFATAGFVGGLVYWLLAGRRA